MRLTHPRGNGADVASYEPPAVGPPAVPAGSASEQYESAR